MKCVRIKAKQTMPRERQRNSKTRNGGIGDGKRPREHVNDMMKKTMKRNEEIENENIKENVKSTCEVGKRA